MIHNLRSPKTNKKGKRVGRGGGSGKGFHTTGKGHKGQRSRSGYTKPGPLFEGGQNPIAKRLPKLRGLTSINSRKRGYKTSKLENAVIQTSELNKKTKDGDVITKEYLIENGFVKSKNHKNPVIKVLFDDEVSKKLTFEGVKISKSAAKSIEKAGGEIK